MARRLVIALGSSAFVAAAVLACSSDSFDDLQLDAGYRFLPDSTADQDAPVDSGFHSDGAPIDPTGGDVDSGNGDDGGNNSPTGCTTCDCDKDGYDRPSCGDGQGKDCNDNDPSVHPGAVFSESATSDTDCSGKVEKAFAPNVACTGLVCPAISAGFTTDVGCGQSGTYVTCKEAVLVLGCQVDTSMPRKQACK